jgi:uncharacterized protein YraI
MKPKRRLLALFVMMFLCVVWNVPRTLRAQAVVQVTTTADVNLRAEPRANAEILTVIPAGTALPAIGRNQQTTWIQVTFTDKTGWVSASFLAASGNLRTLPVTVGQTAPTPTAGGGAAQTEGVTGTVRSNGLSVRQLPSVTSNKLGLLPAGTVVVLTGRQGSGNRLWVRFSFQGQDAWLAGWLLKITGDVNSLPAIEPQGAAPTTPAPQGGQPGTNQATLVFVNQLATTLHIVVQGPTPIDVNIGPNSTLLFTVTPGKYVLSASAEGRIGVNRPVTLNAGDQFTWTLHG